MRQQGSTVWDEAYQPTLVQLVDWYACQKSRSDRGACFEPHDRPPQNTLVFATAQSLGVWQHIDIITLGPKCRVIFCERLHYASRRRRKSMSQLQTTFSCHVIATHGQHTLGRPSFGQDSVLTLPARLISRCRACRHGWTAYPIHWSNVGPFCWIPVRWSRRSVNAGTARPGHLQASLEVDDESPAPTMSR